MKFELKYFTGTGNSLKVLNTCKTVFAENNHEVAISAISSGTQIHNDPDIIGFCFPVYAYGIPRICRTFLKQLNRFDDQQKIFVLITAGDADEAGFSVLECERILKKKGGNIVYSGVIQMPANWTTFVNPPVKEEALKIIEAGVRQSRIIASDILDENSEYHEFNFPARISKFEFYKEYWLFKYLGIYNLWRTFKVYETCNGCKLCSRACPTKSIKILDNKPVWSSSCEQCMRCVNICPHKSIYQAYGGETNGKNRYLEPDFKPLKEEKHDSSGSE